MIKVSGYSDDLIEIELVEDGKTVWEEEYDSYGKDTLFKFDDGTKLRMTYNGAWQAVVEKEGTAKHTIEKLIQNDDYYSDLFTIETDKIINVRKERAEDESVD